jgi:copper transport protein
MVLEFSEPLDINSTRVRLFDSQDQLINNGPGAIDPNSPKTWRLTLGKLPTGSYIAVWRARSALDGHVTEGIVPFGIGVSPAGSRIPPREAPNPLTESPTPLEVAARWLSLVTSLLAFGGLPFAVFVWRSESEALTDSLRKVTLLGSFSFIVANTFFLLTQAASAADVSIWHAFGVPLVSILTSYSGWMLIGRNIFTLIALGLIWTLPIQKWWMALLPASVALLTFSLTAHGAAEPQGAVVAVAADFLHVAATVIWLGSLLPLLIAIQAVRRTPDQALPLAILIPRFSIVALVCVGVLSLTGLYSYFLHINQLDLLTLTTYGRVLIVKSALFAVLFLLGAVNLLILSPRLRTRGNELVRAFSRTVRTELLVGALLLLAVGVMTSVAPSQAAWEALQLSRKDITQKSVTVNNVGLSLYVAPARVGDNEFVVDVVDLRPGAQAIPAEVLLRLSNPTHDTNPLQIETQTSDGLRYTARGSYITLHGTWEIEIILRRSGFNDVRIQLELDFNEAAAL